MHILIITDDDRVSEDLVRCLADHTVRSATWHDFRTTSAPPAEVTILIGASHSGATGHERLYAREMELIRRSERPILGIGLGAELIVLAFGGKLEKARLAEPGLLDVAIRREDPLLASLSGLQLDIPENNFCPIRQLPPELVVLAESPRGIEIIRHSERLIYGWEFFPSMLTSADDLSQLLSNFLWAANT
ncbi:MAG: hypothetical protein HY978_02925 [Candidatus Liptonbacteria bacterium]|nr:hypothetical protein [Candidatus Liptonbacteria bacterium]